MREKKHTHQWQMDFDAIDNSIWKLCIFSVKFILIRKLIRLCLSMVGQFIESNWNCENRI